MGCFLSHENLKENYAKASVGGVPDPAFEEIDEAVGLVTGSLDHSSLVEIQVSCSNLRAADRFS
jgi:hypothetical protein